MFKSILAEVTINHLSIAESMYKAYGKSTEYKNFRGDPMPKWDVLPESTQRAWAAAAEEAHRIIAAIVLS